MRKDEKLAKEVEEAMRKSSKIPGLYRANESRFLYRLARRMGNIVEIGCWMGRTTSILLQAANVWHAEVTSVDAFSEMPNGYERATPKVWRSNLVAAGLTPPRLIPMVSKDAAPTYSEQIALLFIDGDHRKEFVSEDLSLWGAKVKLGGVIALHDMFYPSITGVANAVAEWWERERDETGPSWEIIGMVDYTIAFRRKK